MQQPATPTPALTKGVRILLFLALLIALLYVGQEILIPLLLGMLLSMLVLPVCRRLESKGLSRGFSAALSVLMLLLAAALVLFLLIWQLQRFASELNNIEQRVSTFVHQAQLYIKESFGISEQEQKKLLDGQQPAATSRLPGIISGVMASLMGTVINTILTLAYIFLFLYFREHLKKFILKLAPAGEEEKTRHVIAQSSAVARRYLAGLAFMIVGLWIMYGIGFSLIGVESALFFALLCGTLEIVPFIGNITGTVLTVVATLAQGGGGSMVLGVLLVYFVVQFLQTYLLEPIVVGSEVNINPLFTILAIVIGEAIWGIGGMILAIPLLGMIKIVCDHVEPLKPYGFLIGQEKRSTTSFSGKLKKLFTKK